MSQGGNDSVSSEEIKILQGNLSQSLRVSQTYKNNYDIIVSRYQKLLEQKTELQKAVEEWKARAALAIESKDAIERDAEQLYKQWNEYVKNKAEEFAKIQSSMVPSKELEMLRVQMAEELEFPHRQRVEALNTELNKYREAYYKEHKDMELLKTQTEQLVRAKERALLEQQQQHQHKLSTILEQNATLQELVEDTKTLDELREAQRENGELIFKLKHASEELQALQEDRDEVVVACEELKVSALRQVKDAEGNVMAAQQQRNALERKFQDVSEDLKRIHKEKATLHERVVELEQVQLSFRDKVESKQRELKFLQETTEQRLLDVKSDSEAKIDRMAVTLEQHHKDLMEAKRALNEANDKLQYEEKQQQMAVRLAREEEMKNTRTAKRENEQLQTTIKQQQEKMQALELELRNVKREAQESVAASNQNYEAAMDEISSISEQLNKLQQSNEDLRSQHLSKSTELNDLQQEYEDLQLKYRTHLQQEETATQMQNRLLQEKQILQAENEQLMMDIEEERKQHLHKLKDTHNLLQQEREMLQSHMHKLNQDFSSSSSSSSNNKQQTTASSILQLKKEKTKYKTMCIKLRSKVAQLMSENADLKNTHHLHLDAKDTEAAKLRGLVDEHQSENARLQSHLQAVQKANQRTL